MLTPGLPPRMFGTAPNRNPTEPPLPEGKGTPFDWDARLSLDTIREHTKTDDVPAVTDSQLRLYRRASIESAEHYTGLMLAGQRNILEPIQGPSRVRPGHTHYNHKLQHPVADGWVYLYGSPAPYYFHDNVTFRVPIGTRTIKVPIRTGLLDMSNCCDPCSTHNINAGQMAAYKAGFASPDDVPAGVVLGCLQFMAWVVEHPGDELLTSRNRLEGRAGAVAGSNNIALVSGALEIWRQYDPEAV